MNSANVGQRGVEGFRIKYSNEVSLGQVLQAILVLIPAIVFWVRLEARVSSQGESLVQVALRCEKLDETTNLLARNQAVLAALFEEHKRSETKP